MADLNYLINFTDDSLKEPFVLPPKSKNETALSLVLYGYGAAGWGERLQENMVRILENFASENSPKYPTIGQLWYDNGLKAIKVWDGQKWKSPAAANGDTAPTDPVEGDLWYDTSVKLLKYWDGKQWQAITASSSANPPDHPYLGMLWFNTLHNKLYFWDGTNWCKIENDLEEELDAKVDVAGDTMTGFLSLHADPTKPMHAVTKKYADSTFVDTAGDTMTGFLTLSADPTSAMHATTKQYVDKNFIDTAGDTMTGYLTLFADPLQPMHAATKKYIDDMATTLRSEMKNNSITINPANPKNGDIKIVDNIAYMYIGTTWRQLLPGVYA